MRDEARKNIPLRYGNVRATPMRGGKCTRCREPAKLVLKNAFRSSTVCDNSECREREEHWVGNLPHQPRAVAGSWSVEKKVDDRSFKVKRGA